MWNKAAVLGWLILTFLVVGYEMWCAFSGDKQTPPLTDVTVRYAPWWIIMPFLFWLIVHFAIHYAESTGWASKGFSIFSAK